MHNKVFFMVATLGLVLTVGELATIYSQQAFALFRCNSGPVCGGNGGPAGIGRPGGVCTTTNCNMNGASGNGGQDKNGGIGSGLNGIPTPNGKDVESVTCGILRDNGPRSLC